MQVWTVAGAQKKASAFGPGNPFYAKSTLPYQAPPFDKIKDSDYQPAIEAGMAAQRKEIDAIANNPAAPTFENTVVAMEKTGELFNRAVLAFGSVTAANTNDVLEKVQEDEAAAMAAQGDYINLNAKLFTRLEAVHQQMKDGKLKDLDAESLYLIEWDYTQFVKAGAKLNDADKAKLKKLNEEESVLSTAFNSKLLAAAKAAAYTTTDKAKLAGLSDAQIAAAADAAKARKVEWVCAAAAEHDAAASAGE